MNLHARCRANRALPLSGGILDQPAYLMDLFDTIDQERNAFQAKEAERKRDAELTLKLSGGLIGRA